MRGLVDECLLSYAFDKAAEARWLLKAVWLRLQAMTELSGFIYYTTRGVLESRRRPRYNKLLIAGRG